MATAKLCDRCMKPVPEGTGAVLNLTLADNRKTGGMVTAETHGATVTAADLCDECAGVVEGLVADRVRLTGSNGSVFEVRKSAPAPAPEKPKKDAPDAK